MYGAEIPNQNFYSIIISGFGDKKNLKKITHIKNVENIYFE